MYMKSKTIYLSNILYDYHKPVTKLTRIYCLVNLEISFKKVELLSLPQFSSSLSMRTTLNLYIFKDKYVLDIMQKEI